MLLDVTLPSQQEMVCMRTQDSLKRRKQAPLSTFTCCLSEPCTYGLHGACLQLCLHRSSQ